MKTVSKEAYYNGRNCGSGYDVIVKRSRSKRGTFRVKVTDIGAGSVRSFYYGDITTANCVARECALIGQPNV